MKNIRSAGKIYRKMKGLGQLVTNQPPMLTIAELWRGKEAWAKENLVDL
jgi:hypothetical protein